MFPPSTYTATCWRDGSSWIVHIPELSRTARAARLSQVEGVARQLVDSVTRGDSSACRVVVDLLVRHSLSELLDAAAAARQDSDRVSVEAVTLRRGLARQLVAEGFDVRDVAALLGLSYGRALQLVGDAAHHAARPAVPVQSAASGALGTWRLPAPRSPDDPAAPGHTSAAGHSALQHRSYRHEAFLYRGEQEFLDGMLPFVRDGVALGQPVMVAVVPQRLEPLRAACGAAAEDVYWVDMAELGGNPARIIPAWRQFVDEHGAHGATMRGVGEPVWAGRRPAELVECQLHEALLNLAVEPDTPLWLRCPYDAEALPPDVLAEASRSHPAIVEGEDYRGSTRYGGADHAETLFADELPEPTASVEELSFDDGSVASLRRLVHDSAAHAGLDSSRVAELGLAVTEAAMNSVRHGGGGGRLRVWKQDGALVCEVQDQGRIEDLLVGRRIPSSTARSGRGLWLANQLSDLVQVRSTARGSAVRVLSWLRDAEAAG